MYCVAGGNHAENGFLVDIKAQALESCMRNNYFTAVYAAKSLLDIWTEDDLKGPIHPRPDPRIRQIVFVTSAAAFLGSPGSISYTREYFLTTLINTLVADGFISSKRPSVQPAPLRILCGWKCCGTAAPSRPTRSTAPFQGTLYPLDLSSNRRPRRISQSAFRVSTATPCRSSKLGSHLRTRSLHSSLPPWTGAISSSVTARWLAHCSSPT